MLFPWNILAMEYTNTMFKTNLLLAKIIKTSKVIKS